MNIKSIENPKTQLYTEFKSFVLSKSFSWYWYQESMPFDSPNDEYHNVPFLSHLFMERPESTESKFPKVNCDYVPTLSKLFLEILKHNNIDVRCFLRMNANCVLSSDRVLNTIPHVDHNYPHKNIVIYLTDSGGNIVVNNEIHDPKEDDVIVFDGQEHYVQTPKPSKFSTRRIVLLATFI